MKKSAKKYIRPWVLVLAFVSISFWVHSQNEKVKGADAASVCFLDTVDYGESSSPEKKRALSRTVLALNSDVIVLAGIRDQAALDLLQKSLKEYPFARLVNASDKTSHLALLAKAPPAEFREVTHLTYKIRDKEKNYHLLPVKRGFLHAVFEKNGYQWHLLGAHLYGRSKHPLFNQTDMRRYEARQLRYYVNDLMKKEPDANILIVGNLNDYCGKSTIKDLYNRRFGIKKRLFDLRPLDEIRTSWTHWNRESDEYERIDYAICSSSMIPEIRRDHTSVHQLMDWLSISPHRPLTVGISLKDMQVWTKDKLARSFPNTIFEISGATHFEEEKKVGKGRKRQSPSQKSASSVKKEEKTE